MVMSDWEPTARIYTISELDIDRALFLLEYARFANTDDLGDFSVRDVAGYVFYDRAPSHGSTLTC
jgi:hypothetical protein